MPTERTGKPLRERVDWPRVINTIGLLGLVIIVLPFAVFAVPQAVGAQHSYVVLSGSMQPAMQPGDVILVEDVDPAAIQPGDVITFGGVEQVPTTHRVVEVLDRGGAPAFRTKGDANENADREFVPASRVQGRVMTVAGHLLVLPAIGYVIEFAGTELGFALLVAVPVALFAAFEIRYVVGSTRGREQHRPVVTTGHRDTPAERTAGTSRNEFLEHPSHPVDTAAGDDEVAYTLQPGELRLGLAVLVAFSAYSLWFATDDPNGWTVGVAVAVGVATVLLAALYVFGGTAGGEADEVPSTESWPTLGRNGVERQPPGGQRREQRRSTTRRVGHADGGDTDD